MTPGAVPASTRETVDAFWSRLERLRVEEMLARAARPADEVAHREALADLDRAARETGRQRAVEEARRAVDDWVIALFNQSTSQPGWLEANWGRPGTVEDRANLAASLGQAVAAILVADRLDPGATDELLGAWADLVG